MSHFAEVQPTTQSNIFVVSQVIVADQSFIDTLPNPSAWIETSYNTYGNVHYAPSPPALPMTPDGGVPVRANYAGMGYTYDTNYTIGDFVGVFYAPQPYASWILNTSTFLWEAPVPMPTSGDPYKWDEATKSWVIVT